MGIDYSLCLITKRKDSDTLLPSLLTVLDADSRDRIGTLDWSPDSELMRPTLIGTSEMDARGIAGFKLSDKDSPNAYCLSLDIQLEADLQALLGDHRFKCFDEPGSFGCMWTSVFAGEHFILLEMTAATSGMSAVLRQSQAIHATWISLAKNANAVLGYIDVQEQIALQLFPTYGDLTLPDCNTLAYDGDVQFSVDRMVAFLLATTGG